MMFYRTTYFSDRIIKLFLILILASFALCQTAQAEWVDWTVDGNTTATFEDNINHAANATEKRSEEFFSANISAGRAYQLGDYSRIYTAVNFNGDLHNLYAGLDQYSLGGRISLSHKLGLGLEQPVVSLNFSGKHVFSASRLRNGNSITTGVQLMKRFGEQVQFFGGYNFDYFKASTKNSNLDLSYVQDTDYEIIEEIESKASSVFDLKGHTLNACLRFVPVQDLQFSAGYSWRYGDVVSNVQSTAFNNAGYDAFLEKMKAISTDDVFSGWNYRAVGTTHNYDASMLYSFWAGHGALNFAYRHSETHAAGIHYQNNIMQLNFSYSY